MTTIKLTGEQVRDRLIACRKALPDLFTRNWSGPDEWRFAVYTIDDSFVGCVSVLESARITESRATRLSKSERTVLTEFCRVFNAAVSL